jgi:hypothetical protein
VKWHFDEESRRCHLQVRFAERPDTLFSPNSQKGGVPLCSPRVLSSAAANETSYKKNAAALADYAREGGRCAKALDARVALAQWLADRDDEQS